MGDRYSQRSESGIRKRKVPVETRGLARIFMCRVWVNSPRTDEIFSADFLISSH
jgi:hypothetical protein